MAVNRVKAHTRRFSRPRVGRQLDLSMAELSKLSDWDVMNLVNREQERFFGVLRANIKEHVRAVGTALLVLRDRIPGGEWAAWLAKNWKGSVRSAERYMRVAANWELIRSQGLDLEDVTLVEVLGYLAHALNRDGTRRRKAV